MTGQAIFDSYENAGADIAVALINALAVEHAFGRPVGPAEPLANVRQLLEADPTWPSFREEDLPGLVTLAARLRDVVDSLAADDLDAAAGQLNDLLAAHPAHPHLAKEHGRWRVHHHPADAALLPMATAICAEGLARLVGTGMAGRLGICGSDACDRVFLDSSKNASRRFCSTTCQNRVKAAAFRRRHTATGG